MWYSKKSEEIFKDFNVDPNMGLSAEEADKRLQSQGKNKLKGKKAKSIFQLFAEQLNDILIYILLVAAVISGFLGEISDAVIIFIVILINAVVGVIQESKAEKSLEALQKLSTPRAVVKRDGKIIDISSEDIVTGDIVLLDAGRYVPCDLRMIECANLQIEESALTGESVPVSKTAGPLNTDENISLGDQKNMAFMSTLVTYGRGTGIAINTGMNTEVGKIAKMLDTNENIKTPLQKKLTELGKILGFGAIIICVIMMVIGVIQGRDLMSMFMTSISLAVAAIPEGLAAVVTIVLAMGVQKMIKENAIIRKLPAVETLGAVNIICSDKTGTLTQNKMTVMKILSSMELKDSSSYHHEDKDEIETIKDFMLCNDATYTPESETGDPTEIALLVMGFKRGINKKDLDSHYPRVKEIPFDSDRKLMSTMHKYNDKYKIVTKGAMDNLLPLCNSIYMDGEVKPMTEEYREQISSIFFKMSDEALRVLGVAYKFTKNPDMPHEDFEKDLIFSGLVGMIDPPRLEVKDSIAKAAASGIKTIMITGDHKNTAFAIARDLGISKDIEEVLSGGEIDKLSDDDLFKSINNYRVFARVSPEHKVRIVKAFRDHDNVVSMTGDGVNDAPSLKSADIGVAMGITGTDVAKGAADMVLTDDNFSTIVKAVEQGRHIYNNIRKSIFFLLSCNLGEIMAIFIAILLNWNSPLLPIHILWVNLITDTLPALSLGVDKSDDDIMKEKPRNQKDSLFKGAMGSIILNGILIGLLTLSAFVIGIRLHSNHAPLLPIIPTVISDSALKHGQTMAFIVLSVSQLMHSFNLRSKKHSIFSIGVFTNKYLVFSFLLGLFLQNIIIAVPFLANIFKVNMLSMEDWIVVTILSIMPLIVNELVKFIKYKKN
ncbi:Ca2+-transporting ATPase [Hathewaya proteolytica DSM 3090]|uniref:P-type Ca(2+) transporter n=1 Tax=Hathewaya proteolytica DSM 3090 TaxID=1121331 RepID=A0A1M6QF52_9CLOT|nr:cation-translocating P-type ATPase [Hathewaya proteolytica]SHK18826.1 Ca2+-transporting ATPase [Hathewaya proteolytica DSM 3090]